MPHLNKRNATLQRLRSVALHVFKCGILPAEVWHYMYLSVALGTMKCGILSLNNPFLYIPCFITEVHTYFE